MHEKGTPLGPTPYILVFMDIRTISKELKLGRGHDGTDLVYRVDRGALVEKSIPKRIVCFPEEVAIVPFESTEREGDCTHILTYMYLHTIIAVLLLVDVSTISSCVVG